MNVKTNKSELKAIVRCHDCRGWDGSWVDKNDQGYGWCQTLGMMTDKSWWCANGKKGK